jgi:hypothetical protein
MAAPRAGKPLAARMTASDGGSSSGADTVLEEGGGGEEEGEGDGDGEGDGITSLLVDASNVDDASGLELDEPEADVHCGTG